MKIYIKLTGTHPCEGCGEFTHGRLLDTSDRSYEVIRCRKCHRRSKRGGEMLKERFGLNLVEWLILITILIIMARVTWVIFFAPDQPAE